MALGRWKSMAWLLYITLDDDLLVQLNKSLKKHGLKRPRAV